MKLKIAAFTRNNKIFGIDYNLNETLEQNVANLMDPYTQENFLREDTVLSTWWYLHGDLQALIGFDRGIILNYGECLTSLKRVEYPDNKYFNVLFVEDGIYDVEVLGVSEPCIAYLWKDKNMLRGLVCLKRDIEGCKEAFEKYVTKPLIL